MLGILLLILYLIFYPTKRWRLKRALVHGHVKFSFILLPMKPIQLGLTNNHSNPKATHRHNNIILSFGIPFGSVHPERELNFNKVSPRKCNIHFNTLMYFLLSFKNRDAIWFYNESDPNYL